MATAPDPGRSIVPTAPDGNVRSGDRTVTGAFGAGLASALALAGCRSADLSAGASLAGRGGRGRTISTRPLSAGSRERTRVGSADAEPRPAFNSRGGASTIAGLAGAALTAGRGSSLAGDSVDAIVAADAVVEAGVAPTRARTSSGTLSAR